ncbi:multiheme c-type cytochrome [Chitinophaga sp. CB10]|uniref:multiheme c-type cytochrome n=1 Tax=Chitinophaga sp. CB10 TaxID=1891659 RepID=UPI0025C29FE4|nr:multiheme c-type cytochrome [Chitinophaga sp. CB10]
MPKRLLYLLTLLVLLVTILSQCVGTNPDPRGPAYAGDDACKSCHRPEFEKHRGSAHFFASARADEHSVLGSFIAPANQFSFPGGATVQMVKEGSQLYQQAYRDGRPMEKANFAVTMGQGRKAQTYLSYKEKKYYQLPISYFTQVHSWANSPGFPATQPYFGRVVPADCFSCHSSYVKYETAFEGMRQVETFAENEVMYGINCERCHGPAREHADFHTNHPKEKSAQHIARIGALTRQQQVDMCAVCHAGLKTPQRSLFAFRPGDKLSDFIMADYLATGSERHSNDVHGNQYQLLTASKCYRASNQLTCNTCHNPHEDNRSNLQTYNYQCLSCHQPATAKFCTSKEMAPELLQQQCVNCHMPVQPSRVITLLPDGKPQPVADSLRSHLIKVYRQAISPAGTHTSP